MSEYKICTAMSDLEADTDTEIRERETDREREREKGAFSIQTL